MKRMSLICVIIILALTSCEISSKDPAAGKDIHLVSVALDYADTDMNSLKGTVNDQDALTRQLAFLSSAEGTAFHSTSFCARDGRWYVRRHSQTPEGMDSSDIEYISPSAMKGCILNHLEKLVQTAGEEDIIIFYYAGHGAESLSDNDSTLNGALVVGDITFPSIGTWQDVGSNLSSLITVAELVGALSRISAPKLVILDSCYSGALMPEGQNVTKEGEILESVSALFREKDDGNNRFYLLSSSRDDEMSYEYDSMGMYHGFFSGSLLQSLGYRFYDDGVEGTGYPDRPAVTCSSLYEDIKSDGLWEYQNPQINPYHVDLVLFSLPTTSRF